MIGNLSYLMLKRTATSWKSHCLILHPGVCPRASDCLQGCIELHQPHIAIPGPAGLVGFSECSPPRSRALLLLRAGCLVSVPPVFTKKEPLTPTRHILLLCSLAEDCNSIGCSFQARELLWVSQNQVILVSSGWNVNAKPACMPAVSPACLSQASGISPVALHWGAVWFSQCADNFILCFQWCCFQ